MSPWRCLSTTLSPAVLLLGGAASHPMQPALQAETAVAEASLLQELGQPMCERPWSIACPLGRTCDREPVGFWCGQYDGDPEACVHQFEWQPSDDSLRPCHAEDSCEEGDECDAKERCTTGSSPTECAEPPWTMRGLLDIQPEDEDEDGNTAVTSLYAAHADEECSEWTGLPEDETAEMQCGVLMLVHQPNAGGERLYSYFDQKARGEDADARNGWEFFNLQWSSRKCAGQECFDGWDTTGDKWATLMQKVRLSEKPKLIVHLYNVFPGLGMGFLENAVSPMQALLEAKGCALKLSTTLREPTAQAVAHALEHGIPSTATNLAAPQSAFRKFVAQWSNHQTKYLLLNKRLWPAALHENNATLDSMLLPGAQDLLSRFGLVGRHEAMPSFVHALNKVLGWPKEWSLSDLNSGNEVDEEMATVDAVGLVAAAHNLSKRDVRLVRGTRQTDEILYSSFCDASSRGRSALSARRGERGGRRKGVEGHDSAPLRELLFPVSRRE